MSRTLTRRLLALSPYASRAEAPTATRTAFQCHRARQFSSTPRQNADEKQTSAPSAGLDNGAQLGQDTAPKVRYTNRVEGNDLGSLSRVFQEGETFKRSERQAANPDAFAAHADYNEEPHHLHVFAHKHNCHITLTRPNREPIISLSNGNLGFKKSNRKHFDTCFQLSAYVLQQIKDKGLVPQIKKLELCMRGFGPGREALTKAILGSEGRLLRGKIVKVSDATRLKFGGVKSPRLRRLG